MRGGGGGWMKVWESDSIWRADITWYLTTNLIVPVSPKMHDIGWYLEKKKLEMSTERNVMSDGLRADILKVIPQRISGMSVGESVVSKSSDRPSFKSSACLLPSKPLLSHALPVVLQPLRKNVTDPIPVKRWLRNSANRAIGEYNGIVGSLPVSPQ